MRQEPPPATYPRTPPSPHPPLTISPLRPHPCATSRSSTRRNLTPRAAAVASRHAGKPRRDHRRLPQLHTPTPRHRCKAQPHPPQTPRPPRIRPRPNPPQPHPPNQPATGRDRRNQRPPHRTQNPRNPHRHRRRQRAQSRSQDHQRDKPHPTKKPPPHGGRGPGHGSKAEPKRGLENDNLTNPEPQQSLAPQAARRKHDARSHSGPKRPRHGSSGS